MIWLTWRQSRLEMLIGGAALALVAAYLLWSGQEMISSYREAGLPACVAQRADDEGCRAAVSAFLQRFDDLRGLKMVLLLCLPFLIGLLLAAPTVLDFEQGTYRLAWMQSVTRRRWLATKFGYGLAIAAGVSLALMVLWRWWLRPVDAIAGEFNGNGFDFEGTASIAYTVFAFAVCLAVGTLLRRTVATFGIGLVVFLVARGAVADQLRPRFLAPIERTWGPTEPAPAVALARPGDGSWVINQGYLDSVGHGGAAVEAIVRSCMADTASKAGDRFNACLRDHGILNTIAYHPADRYWTFQAIETALFLGVAAALLGITFWWVTRRIA
jgi:hypothetical protein